jgi:hypothetical protein
VKFSTTVKYGLTAAFILLMVTVLHYNLPRTQVMQIIGTDIKRLDSSDKVKADGAEQVQGKKGVVVSRDVRFINAVSQSGKAEVFRNEDTGWGWPPYFKFNSAECF